MWIMISEYDLSFDYEYKLFESLNPVCQTAGKISSLHCRSRRIRPFQQGMHTRTGNRPSHAVAQGTIFLQGGRPLPPAPLAPALECKQLRVMARDSGFLSPNILVKLDRVTPTGTLKASDVARHGALGHVPALEFDACILKH